MGDETIQKSPMKTDEELIRLIHAGDRRAMGQLCVKYASVSRKLAQRYAGGAVEPEDLMQEGMLGLLVAARRFDPQRQVPFESYCRRCMTSKMLSALHASQALKRRGDAQSVPLHEHEEASALLSPAPDEVFIENEDLRQRGWLIHSLLSTQEQETLRLYLCGRTYEQIAATLQITRKAVDHLLQRIRRKLRTAYHEM